MPKDALVIIDIKTSRRKYLARTRYTLRELISLQDQWVSEEWKWSDRRVVYFRILYLSQLDMWFMGQCPVHWSHNVGPVEKKH